AIELPIDAAGRLVELVEERRGPVYAEEAARKLFALRHAPVGLARSLLEDVIAEDTRLAWRGDSVGLAAPPGEFSYLRDRRRARAGVRARRRVRGASRPGCADRARDQRADRIARQRAA